MSRLHVIGLPHTQTTRAYDHCAYTAKVRKFADMMSARGHEVLLYASEENEAGCAELIPCITRAEQEQHLGGHWWWATREVQNVDFNPALPFWRIFHNRAIGALEQRLQPRDFICLIMGASAELATRFPNLDRAIIFEFGVGYVGTATYYRCFESYAWMHTVYGFQQGAANADGRFYDTVIPNYYDPAEFPGPCDPDDYFLFMSRMTPRKGYQIAIEATDAIGAPLKIAGVGGDRPEHSHVEYVGHADTWLRAQLMRRARAVFVPTIYVEPFGGVAAEAMLCGTPVITTDWGAFSEYVEPGVDGYRCRTMREFVDAAAAVGDLDRERIRGRAQARFSFDAVAPRYEEYLARLQTLWGAGFYEAAA